MRAGKSGAFAAEIASEPIDAPERIAHETADHNQTPALPSLS